MATIGLAALHVVQLSSYTQVSDHDIRTKLDSHADMTAVGTSMALVIHDYEQPLHEHGYTGEILPDENCHIVSAVVANDHPETGDTFMLVFNHTILIDKLPTNLVSPMQLHDVGIPVNDKPKSMASKPTDDHSTIVIPDDDNGITLRRGA